MPDSAVIDAPASAEADSSFDPTNYDPSPAETAGAMFGDEPSETPTPSAREQTPPPETKPAVEEKPQPDKPEEKPLSVGASARKQLQAREAELAELRSQYAETQKALEAAKTDTRAQQLEAELKQIREEHAAVQRKLAAKDPYQAAKPQQMLKTFIQEVDAFVETVPGLNRKAYNALVDEFKALPRGTPEYADALRSYKEALGDQYGVAEIGPLFQQVLKGVQFDNQHAAAVQEAANDGGKAVFEEELGRWNSGKKQVEENWPKWFEAPADAALTDAFNANLFIKNWESEMKPEDVAKVDKHLQTFVVNAMNGMQPLTRADFAPGMTDEQVEAELSKRGQEQEARRLDFMRAAAVSMKIAMYNKPALIELAQLRELNKARVKATPPDPTNRSEGTRASDTEDDPSPEQAAAALFTR